MRIAKSVAGGKIRRAVLLMALLAVVPGLAGCGSTKVYTAEKTLVYRDNLYNLGQVQQVGSRIDLAPAGGQPLTPAPNGKSAIKEALDQYETLLFTSYFELDGKDVIFEQVNIDSYSDYNKHFKRFDKARDELTDFMSDAKETQLKLD